MAKVEYGSVTITSTGLNIITLNDSTLQPERIVLWVADSSTVTSAGFGDLTKKFTGGSAYGDESTAHELTHYKNVSGTKTKQIEIDLPATAFDYAGEVSITVGTLVSSTKVYFVVEDS